MSAITNEAAVRSIVDLLRDKTEAERERHLEELPLNLEEKAEVRNRLWAPKPSATSEEHAERRKRWQGDPVFQSLVHDARRGRVVLFIGAGVSLDVGMPSSSALVDALKRFAQERRLEISPDRDYHLDEIADVLERAGMRRNMLEELGERIREATVGPNTPHKRGFYRLLPYLGEVNRLIITTNWDDLIERALEETRESVVAIRRDQDLPLMAAAPHAVLKLHGDFTDPKTIVVSGTDYARARDAITQRGGLAGSLWGAAASLLAQKTFVFVGYRLADRDMILLRTLIGARQLDSDVRHYIVGPFSDHEVQGLRDWVNMEVIRAEAGEFFVALAQELAQFANRRDDLERIFRLEAAPFLEFYAPFGAGKRTLCDEIERRAQGEGWKPEDIIRVDLGPGEADGKGTAPPLTSVELVRAVAGVIRRSWIRQGEALREALEDKPRFLAIFENTEAMEAGWPNFVQFISQIPAQAVDKHNREGKRSRLILAGRYPVEGWPFSFKRRAEIFPLSPFSLSAVREMAGKYVLFSDPEATIDLPSDTLVRQLYDLTGRSNPRFIKHILDDLLTKKEPGGKTELGPEGKLKLPPELAEHEIRTYLESFLDVIRDEVWSSAPTELVELFAAGLCVLRVLNASLLFRLASEDLFRDQFRAAGGPGGVIAGLRERHLLTLDFPLFRVDPVVRRIHAHALRMDDPGKLERSHRAAAGAWRALLPSVRDTEQLRFFQEWLYHVTNYLSLDVRGQADRWSELQAEINEVEFLTAQAPPVGMGEALLRGIEEKPQRDKDRDGELLDVLVEAIGEKYYEELRQTLVEKPEVEK